MIVPTLVHNIAALRAIQDREGLRHVHLVEIRPDGFAVAHTDAERAAAQRVGGAPLTDCPIHRWLTCRTDAPAASGVYRIARALPFARTDTDGYTLEPVPGGLGARAEDLLPQAIREGLPS